MKTWKIKVATCLLIAMTLGTGAAADEATVDELRESPAFTSEQLEFFEREVRPLFVEHCYECHSVGADKLQASLLMDSRQALLVGGDSGPAILPGDADASLLIEAVRYDSYEMPPSGKLPDHDIEVLEKWVAMQAPWPAESAPSADNAAPKFNLQERKESHWAWQPLGAPTPPSVTNSDWPNSEIDRFVLAKLESAGITPARDADRSALLRRLCFDITGLPPTPAQVQEFVSDDRSDAVERLVDRLLDSPQFGERWGRHWLDLVRYAESRGHEFDNDSRNAYQYRDYVVRALNADLPYDQFVREHIAGDLLETPRLHSTEGYNESILGTGFWFLGEWVHSPVDIRKDESDRFDNMIDVMSKAFQGVTVSCARCHDHKFDAISTEDYYSLSGFLQSSQYRQVRFESLEHNRAIAKKLDALDNEFRSKLNELLDGSLTKNPPPQSDVESSAVESSALETTCDFESALSAARQPLGNLPSLVFDYGMLHGEAFKQDGFIFGARPISAGSFVAPAAAIARANAEAEKTVDARANADVEADNGETSESDETIATGITDPLPLYAVRTAAVADPFWNGLVSINEKGVHARSRLATMPRPGRTLRSPTFVLTDGILHCRVRGTGHIVACVDSHRLLAGPLHGETVRGVGPKDQWVTLNLGRYIGHGLHLEFTPAEDAELEVVCVLQGASAEDVKQVEAIEATVADIVTRRQSIVESMIADRENDLSQAIVSVLNAWKEQRDRLRDQVQWQSHLAMAMMDGSGEDDHILIRGSSSNPGRVAPRSFLTAISGPEPMHIARGSGRLELADAINSPSNPLTSRVIVNRVWHHLLGRGIVPTADDFGVLGLPPTHPELLDYLAQQFLADGQSIKGLIKRIVLSRVYQMSTYADQQSIALDPKNSLWHYFPPKRLEGESIRDALLAVSGEIDLTPFGEPIPIHLTPFMDGRGRPGASGPLDGNGRRSIYIAVRRNFLSPFMLAFDTPAPFSTMGRRNVSNVPAQALILMNDPFVVEQTQKWGERVVAELPNSGDTQDTLTQRIKWMYLSAFGRSPQDSELEMASAYLQQSAEARRLDLNSPELWSDLGHAFVNAKEFIYLR